MLATLAQRNFALLWSGSLISSLGTTMLYIALPFYVYAHTNSVLATGLLFIAQIVPSVFLGSIAGVFVDRWDRRWTMVIADLARAMVIVGLLTVSVYHWLWILYVVAGLEATLSLFFAPASSALIPRLVAADHLPAANALGAVSDEITRLAGPALGGALLGLLGLPSLVLIDSASYLCSAGLIALLALPPLPRSLVMAAAPAPLGMWRTVGHDWIMGLRLVAQDRLLLALFLMKATQMLGQGLFNVLFVVFVRVVLHGTPAVFGWLGSAQGVGGLLGGLVLAQIGRRVPPWRLVVLGLLGSSCLMVVLINVPLLPLDLTLGALAGVVLVGEAVGEQTLLQTSVADAYRGRVMAAYGTTISLVLLGGMGLGSAIGTSRTVVPLLNVAEGLYFCAGLIALLLLRAMPSQPGPHHGQGQETAGTA